MAASRSRSRSRERTASPHFKYDAFIRQWASRLQFLPEFYDSKAYFQLCKPQPDLPGDAWVVFGEPYELTIRDITYKLEFTIWHGAAPASACRVPLVRSSSNGFQALVFNWPGAKGHSGGRVVVSRILGMSLLYDARAHMGIPRFDSRLHVHHRDGNHANCLLSNLEVKTAQDHIRGHRGSRRR